MLAALGPKVLRLAGERTAGALPYLVRPSTPARRGRSSARGRCSPRAQGGARHRPRAGPRARPRPGGHPLPRLVNYTSNLRRLGWTDDDLAGGGSDALVDALVAHGSADQVAAQLSAHLDAGADHVAIQLLTGPTPTGTRLPGPRPALML
jgi:probable F420-dependent oxidoreductase